jgi:hypothetical protein
LKDNPFFLATFAATNIWLQWIQCRVKLEGVGFYWDKGPVKWSSLAWASLYPLKVHLLLLLLLLQDFTWG